MVVRAADVAPIIANRKRMNAHVAIRIEAGIGDVVVGIPYEDVAAAVHDVEII